MTAKSGCRQRRNPITLTVAITAVTAWGYVWSQLAEAAGDRKR